MRPSTPTQIYGVFWIILPRIVFLTGNGEIFENHRSDNHRIVCSRRPLRLLLPHAVASEPDSRNRHAFQAIPLGGTACPAGLRRGPDAAYAPAHRSAYAGRRFRFQCLFRLGAGALPCGRCSDRQSRNHPFRIRTLYGLPLLPLPCGFGRGTRLPGRGHYRTGQQSLLRRRIERHPYDDPGTRPARHRTYGRFSGQLGFPGEASAPFRSGRHTFRPAELHLRYERSSGPFRIVGQSPSTRCGSPRTWRRSIAPKWIA